jgi:hypothetical protein
MKYIKRTIKWTVVREKEPLFDELATDIEIVDEAAGEFVEVKQHVEGNGKIQFGPEDWPAIREAIDCAVKLCRK